MTDAKRNPKPGKGFAHDFDCTHDPCMCDSFGAHWRRLGIATRRFGRELLTSLGIYRLAAWLERKVGGE